MTVPVWTTLSERASGLFAALVPIFTALLAVPYTRGVLFPWKMAAAGPCFPMTSESPSTAPPVELVDAEARDKATKRLAQIAARKAAKSAETAPPAVVKPKPAPPPAPLRDQVRAALLRRA
jgi:hypothetical protein